MKVCIDIDDFHSFPRWDCSDVLLKLVDKFPGIKFTIFFTPCMKNIPMTDYPQALDRVRELVKSGNVEIFLHGLNHKRFLKGEFGGLTKGQIKKRLEKAESFFRKTKIKCKKGIKFPWDICTSKALSVIEKMDYILFSNKYRIDFKGRQVIWKNKGNLKTRLIQTENFSYGKPILPNKKDIVYYHGHAQNVRHNGIRESFSNFVNELIELRSFSPVEFIFCSEVGKNI